MQTQNPLETSIGQVAYDRDTPRPPKSRDMGDEKSFEDTMKATAKDSAPETRDQTDAPSTREDVLSDDTPVAKADTNPKEPSETTSPDAGVRTSAETQTTDSPKLMSETIPVTAQILGNAASAPLSPDVIANPEAARDSSAKDGAVLALVPSTKHSLPRTSEAVINLPKSTATPAPDKDFKVVSRVPEAVNVADAKSVVQDVAGTIVSAPTSHAETDTQMRAAQAPIARTEALPLVATPQTPTPTPEASETKPQLTPVVHAADGEKLVSEAPTKTDEAAQKQAQPNRVDPSAATAHMAAKDTQDPALKAASQPVVSDAMSRVVPRDEVETHGRDRYAQLDATAPSSKEPQTQQAQAPNTPPSAVAYGDAMLAATSAEVQMGAGDTESGAEFRLESLSSTAARESVANVATTMMSRTQIPAQIAGQIAEAARVLPDRPIEISLSPEELGKVRLTFQLSESGAMSVVVQAEKPDTAELLRRNIHMLSEEFAALGYEGSQFAFASDGQANDGGASGNQSGDESPQGSIGDSMTAARGAMGQGDSPLHLDLSGSSRLDVRV